ncbi:MAG: orotate phosphoribosyltransferase [Candidatus Thermoplasmatota archaeon]|jgi:hypothetical protein|nr:orotate phosphoribosyltransferase [Candidatus Thermoplasmatota archaeon]
MGISGLCTICGKPSVIFSCMLCGKLVCRNCFDEKHNICVKCSI